MKKSNNNRGYVTILTYRRFMETCKWGHTSGRQKSGDCIDCHRMEIKGTIWYKLEDYNIILTNQNNQCGICGLTDDPIE